MLATQSEGGPESAEQLLYRYIVHLKNGLGRFGQTRYAAALLSISQSLGREMPAAELELPPAIEGDDPSVVDLGSGLLSLEDYMQLQRELDVLAEFAISGRFPDDPSEKGPTINPS